MLDSYTMDALARLSQREVRGKLELDQERVAWLRELLRELGGLPADVSVAPLVAATLALGCAEGESTKHVDALVLACQGNPEAVAHATSLLDMAIRMQPVGRPRRPRQEQPYHVRAVGQ